MVGVMKIGDEIICIAEPSIHVLITPLCHCLCNLFCAAAMRQLWRYELIYETFYKTYSVPNTLYG
jgi:hypothetical protein